MSNSEMNAFARRLRALEKGRIQVKTPSLAQSSIEGGALTAVDDDANQTMVIGRQFDDTNAAAVVTGPTPPIPSTPGVFSSPGAIRVYWDGTFANALVAPMDFSRVTIHVMPVAEYDDATFDPTNQAYIYGSIEQATGGEISPILEPGEYAVVLVTWTIAGKFSEESQVGLGTSEEFVADTGPDGFAPATAPNVAWAGGIGSVFYRWTPVPNADPTEYALYVRAGEPPTTADDTYLVAAGNIQQATVREAWGPNPDDLEGPEVEFPVTPGTDYYGIVVAYDADGKGPDSLPAIAQSVEINSPDIATDAIATRHLQADSVGVDQIQAGSIDANKLAARLILASEMLLGELDNSGLDPAAIYPNLLPPLDPALFNDQAGPAVGTWGRANAAGWTVTNEEFSPVNDDPYWERMAPGSLQAARFERSSTGFVTGSTWRTQVVVEPDTEYRFELNSAMPGMDPAMAASGVSPALNSVSWYASSDSSFQGAETISWKSFRRQDTPRPDLTKFDRGVIKTGAGQTVLWIQMQLVEGHMVPNGGGFVMPMPELRKMEPTTVAAPVVNPSTVEAVDVTPDPVGTTWKASAVWSGTTSSITRSSAIVTPTSSGGSFGPSHFSTPGRYARPGESATFQQSKGIRITTQSGGSGLGLRARIVAPAQAVPSLSPMESLLLGIGFGGVTQSADGLDDFTLTASWYDSANTLISNQALIDLDSAGLGAQAITNLTENYFTLQLSPPVGTATVVVWAEYSNGPAGNIAATVNQTPTLHGLRLYTLDAINYNYGNMAAQHVEMDTNGVRLVNRLGQIQVDLPTDENAVPFFRGGGEFGSLRVTGGASFEGQSEVAKDATISLSDGIKSPVGIPTLTQEYEQYTLQRQPPDGQYPGFSTKPTLNPAEITGMVYKTSWNEFWLAENRGGGTSIWRFGSDGSCRWASLQPGWHNAVPIDDPRTGNNLFVGEYAGVHWAYVYNGTNTVTNRLPDGTVPDNVEPVYTWWAGTNRLYVHYPHIDGSGRHVYKRLAVNNTSGGTMTLESTVVSGSGTSRTSYNVGLAGVVQEVGGLNYSVARDTASADSYAFPGGSGGALNSGARFPLASPPKGFCHDGDNFWQVDNAGKFTKYSDWTWAETNHKVYAGITWFDSDTGGTGVHETDLTKMASATLKKRISGVRVTLPPVPDKGGSDDPDRWRLYAAKSASLTLPANRTSMFLQSQGGSASQQTTYIIPANGLVTSGTNPPAANNFPSSGPGRLFSAAVNSSSNPILDLKGNGEADLGNFKVRSGIANINRSQVWLREGGQSIAANTDVLDDGGYSIIYGDHTSNDGWTGCVYTGVGVFTCNETGWYEIEIGFNWPSTTAGRRWSILWINPSSPSNTNAFRFKSHSYTSGNFQTLLSATAYLTAGNTFRAGWRHDGAGALVGTATQGFNFGGTMYSKYLQITRRA